MNLKDYIRSIPDYPKKGILFRDITALIKDENAFAETINQIVERSKKYNFTKIAAIESRGFVFASAVSYIIKKPFIITHIKLGVLSSIISSVLLVAILYYLNLNFFEIDFEKIKESVLITLLFSLGISVIISYFSTSIITGRYISSNIEKLY